MSGPVAQHTPGDILRRIRELAALPAAQPVTNQHVISKVILKRFAATSGPEAGLIYPFRLEYPHSNHKPRGPGGCGKVLNFITFASASVEQLWQETETKLHDALRAVDRNELFASEPHVTTIKEAIALHFARSKATRVLHYRVWAETVAAGQTRWLTEYRTILADQFYKRKGFYPAGNQALELFLDEVMKPSTDLADSGSLFRARIEYIFDQARVRAENAALEILTSGKGEFLIGDVPALTVRNDRDEVGTPGWDSAGRRTLRLPSAGPHHVAALGKTNRTAELSPSQVDDTNARQVAGAIEYVYLRPGSGLEGFVSSRI